MAYSIKQHAAAIPVSAEMMDDLELRHESGYGIGAMAGGSLIAPSAWTSPKQYLEWYGTLRPDVVAAVPKRPPVIKKRKPGQLSYRARHKRHRARQK